MPTGAMPPVLLPARVCRQMAVLVLAVSLHNLGTLPK